MSDVPRRRQSAVLSAPLLLVIVGFAPGCRIDALSPRDAGAGEDPLRFVDRGTEPCEPGSREQCFGAALSLINVGTCRAGEMICQANGWGPCEGAVYPADEVHDGLDNDCDGETDEDFPCVAGDTQACGEVEGECEAGEQACDGGRWGSCEGAVGPEEELCDGKDNDCDGETDEPIECCVPDCDGKSCGAIDGCGGECQDGSCPANETCQAGSCVCEAPCPSACCGPTEACLLKQCQTCAAVSPVQLDTQGSVSATFVSLAVDGAGKVHISFKGGQTHDFDLMYATNASGSWKTTTVDATGNLGYYTALAVDGAGKAHISYYDMFNFGLKYATNASGTWQTETLANAVVGHTSLVVDANGKVHISFHNALTGNGNVYYATNATGAWTQTVVGFADDMTANDSAIGVDGAGKVHIVYEPYAEKGIYYVTNASGSWQQTHLDANTSVWGTTLAVDGAGRVHIAYNDNGNHDLEYATNASGAWVLKTIDTNNVGTYPAMAVDGAGSVFVSYIDSANSAMKYATNASGSWTIHSFGTATTYSGVDVDGTGRLHVAYGGTTLTYFVPCLQ